MAQLVRARPETVSVEGEGVEIPAKIKRARAALEAVRIEDISKSGQ
jgi:hypothetical protein